VSRLLLIALPLLFCSGLCALIDQMVWTRELRLIFGASTAASSAVIAIFIAGLGFGGLFFGSRAERSQQPLALYGRLELAASALTALTPLSLDAVRALYTLSGGSVALGHTGSTVLRMLLSAVVLLPPTFAMGGSLPAIARAIELDSDRSRRALGLAYALNTLGAVAGAALSTFFLLERLGNRTSLYAACVLNALVGACAYAYGRRQSPALSSVEEGAPPAVSAAPVWFVYASAAAVGFAFFALELVWYRMLGPLLGGSVFTFGLILAVALAGIGCGSAFYAAFSVPRSRLLLTFAATCALEALCVLVPYALGDHLAMTALFLQPMAAFGFGGQVLGWVAIALAVVFPAALLSGFQFPLLIALLGQGRAHVARDVGRAYAANTLGAIAGALWGGFGLLPLLGALGAWRALGALLAVWSLFALGLALRPAPLRALAGGLCVAALAATSLSLLRAEGPTAAFRHSQIGVGRVALDQFDGPNGIKAWQTQERRAVDWQTEGIESSVAITHYDGVAFVVNGKSDGSALTDAPTQVMGGLVGAALVPRVQRALVIGLGTGSTAGWLAQLPELERVDVAEIEPAIAQVARRCQAVNQRALDNPKLHVLRGDARELLSLLRTDYDVIFSEPSNPYRAGIASMYAREFYASVLERLRPGGVFVQWLQAYDVDASSVRTIYATLAGAFPHIQTWNGLREDLLLVASREPLALDVAALRARVAAEPFASALRLAWYEGGVEGLFAHFVANESFARAAANSGVPINTDDLSPVEFGFARTARGGTRFTSASLFAAVLASRTERPTLKGAPLDWPRIDYMRETFALAMGSPTAPERLTPDYRNRFAMLSKWVNADVTGAFSLWTLFGPRGNPAEWTAIERLARAELLAYEGSVESERMIGELLHDRPTEASFMRAVYALRHGQRKAGTALLRDALQRYRGDPWPYPLPIARALNNLQLEVGGDAELAQHWLAALAQPFALRVNETARDRARLRLAYALGASNEACVRVFEAFEPYPPWTESMLKLRSDCYEQHAHALRDRAAFDLAAFKARAPTPFEVLLGR